MITREQVADLQPGDVVEVRQGRYPEVVTRGPVRQIEDCDALALGISTLRDESGLPPTNADLLLTVVSCAPRPLYVNHPRTEPTPGDVVRNADGDVQSIHWIHMGGRWLGGRHGTPFSRDELPARLRLLVDGETGQVVPS